MKDKEYIPEFVNMSNMAKLLNLSRSRYYQLVEQGFFLQPVYLIANRCPVYTQEMAISNLNFKQNNVGYNGKVVLFYSSRSSIKPAKTKSTIKQSTDPAVASPSKHEDLTEALEALGLENVTDAKIDSAIQVCFPTGIDNISEDEILREVFRYLKHQEPRT